MGRGQGATRFEFPSVFPDDQLEPIIVSPLMGNGIGEEYSLVAKFKSIEGDSKLAILWYRSGHEAHFD
jgi:hypothetical protein